MAPAVQFRLENAWHPVEGDECGAFVFTLVNLSDVALSDFKLAYTSLTRVKDTEEPILENAVFLKRNANFHQFAPPAGFVLQPGESWTFRVGGLWRPAKHRTDGAKSAYITLSTGQHAAVAVADLMLGGGHSAPPPALLPEGQVTQPFAMLPWPETPELVAGEGFPVALYPAEGASLVELRAVENVLRLFCRLFAVGHAPLSLAPVHQGRAIFLKSDEALGASAYRLDFAADGVTLAYGDVAGLQ
ncbi:MAG: beta-N-acetylhexosaminidase, partial [Agrobacterium tumefaciens]